MDCERNSAVLFHGEYLLQRFSRRVCGGATVFDSDAAVRVSRAGACVFAMAAGGVRARCGQYFPAIATDGDRRSEPTRRGSARLAKQTGRMEGKAMGQQSRLALRVAAFYERARVAGGG